MHVHIRRRPTIKNLPKAIKEKETPAEVEEEPPSPAQGIDACLPSIAEPFSVQPFKSAGPETNSLRRRFKQTYYSDITDRQWNDWRWQVANRVRSMDQLQRFISLEPEEQVAVEGRHSGLPLAITPYFMSLIAGRNGSQALRRTVVPTAGEFIKMPEEADDPLGEEEQSPVPGLVHRYPDRVLFLTVDFCSTYCRYCTRSRVVGRGRIFFNRRRLEQALDYIRSHTVIRDVLLSGGDPLTLGDERLNWLLTRLREIKHVEIIRLGTKIPAVLPQRITPQLVRMLRKHHPLFMSLHFTHADECTPESSRACQRLADAGIPLGSQTVLLRDINDSVDAMRTLMHRLLRMRVRPYYLYQCDPISGSAHFRTPVEKGLEIIRGLRGHTSGYAVPTYVIDAPCGGGKIPLSPDYYQGREGMDVVLKNYEEKYFRYPDTV